MADTVNVQFSHPWQNHNVGDRVSLDANTARRLVQAGYAVPATKAEAENIGVDPATAATARKK